MRDIYAERRFQLPPSYVVSIESHGGYEGDLGEKLGYLVLWNHDTIQGRYEAYEMAQHLSAQWFPFGSDGGGEMLCFDLMAGTDQVYWLPYIGMSDEAPLLQNYSFGDIAAVVNKKRLA